MKLSRLSHLPARISASPFYAFLIGLYPFLALWSANLGQIPPFAVLRSLIVVLVFNSLVLAGSLVLWRRWDKAALFSSLCFITFYSFGHGFDLLNTLALVRLRLPLLAWLAALALGTLVIWRLHRVPAALQRSLTAAALFLVILPVGQVALYELRRPAFPAEEAAQHPSPGVASSPSLAEAGAGASRAAVDAAAPDVYYILLDMYSREDVLKSLGYDNRPFLQELEELGFIVDPCAQSNYDQTHSSMSAVLNMDYLDALPVPLYPERAEENIADFEALIHNSRARQVFTGLGYQFVTFKALYPWLDIDDSDVYFDPQHSVSLLARQEAINFQYLLFRTTLLRPLMDWLESTENRFETLPAPAVNVLNFINPRGKAFLTRQYDYYQHGLYAFDRLAETPGLPGKKFVYAHLFSTHVPFAFHADGAPRLSGQEDVEGYLGSLEYTNRRILEIVRTILAESSTPPVIILQGDHGYPTSPERVRILNALYLPGAGKAAHTLGQTPVNTFRLVLQVYFDQPLALLPDRSYHTPPGQAYRFEPVAPSCAAE